jgi:hypothetical protein
MAEAEKKSSTRKHPKTSVGNISPPIGNRYEQSIGIQQAQRVSLVGNPLGKQYEHSVHTQQAQDVILLMDWVRRVRNAVAGVVDRLRPGRKPYKRAPFAAVAERAIAGGVDRSLTAFRDRVRSLCELEEGISDIPGDTVLEEICKPIYLRAQSKK